MRSVVTGGAGFIGSHIVRELIDRGHEVHVIDCAPALRADRAVKGAVYHTGDIRNETLVKAFLSGATYVFHAAALPRVQYSIEHSVETFHVNVAGTHTLLDAARDAGVKRIVFSSSAAVYGDSQSMPLSESDPVKPMSPYALHKYMGESMCALWSRIYSLETVSLRYFNVYGPAYDPDGPYGLVVGKFISQKKAGVPLTIAGDGLHTRDYIHVHDVARANITAAFSAAGSGEVFNIGTGVETSVRRIAEIIGGETVTIEPRLEPARACADISRAQDVLGWSPDIKIEEGIQSLI